MNDLIRRQVAIDALDTGLWGVEWDKALATAILKDLPSAERRGRWVIRDDPRTEWYEITCSECGENVTSTAPCIGFFPVAKVIWDYCPYCGTRMEE